MCVCACVGELQLDKDTMQYIVGDCVPLSLYMCVCR